mmetsp:Transcript_3168/g.10683  ORF Transcript_3168/g.10683 Transcript_3168/m.10683 type:complete len:246 (-) Transcript_3168:763-1500(-)
MGSCKHRVPLHTTHRRLDHHALLEGMSCDDLHGLDVLVEPKEIKAVVIALSDVVRHPERVRVVVNSKVVLMSFEIITLLCREGLGQHACNPCHHHRQVEPDRYGRVEGHHVGNEQTVVLDARGIAVWPGEGCVFPRRRQLHVQTVLKKHLDGKNIVLFLQRPPFEGIPLVYYGLIYLSLVGDNIVCEFTVRSVEPECEVCVSCPRDAHRFDLIFLLRKLVEEGVCVRAKEESSVVQVCKTSVNTS